MGFMTNIFRYLSWSRDFSINSLSKFSHFQSKYNFIWNFQTCQCVPKWSNGVDNENKEGKYHLKPISNQTDCDSDPKMIVLECLKFCWFDMNQILYYRWCCGSTMALDKTRAGPYWHLVWSILIRPGRNVKLRDCDIRGHGWTLSLSIRRTFRLTAELTWNNQLLNASFMYLSSINKFLSLEFLSLSLMSKSCHWKISSDRWESQ